MTTFLLGTVVLGSLGLFRFLFTTPFMLRADCNKEDEEQMRRQRKVSVRMRFILYFLKSKVVYKASCWDCDDFYIGKTKRPLHDRKTEHFKALSKNCQTSAIAGHITSTGHNIK